ncbi:restriction endonuclease subunit S [Vibrio parahaemolyticus]|uniref:restriction endonuclease subunit S n=1 Tax=Vibrio parahaemolyticus TaxID=670 RepID=UPI00146F13EC|nr:restriction endonuclease subunit S [Vibrio parahaemolyticus]MDF5280161.1 restriction endonuclease subunit S [Vibrio parahaemolyticus]NMU71906.1 restriction endonuclease subunit S [Vibrio parahaemolyticus]
MTFNSIDFADMELGACLELVIDHRGKTPRKLKSDWVESGIPTISAKNVNSGRLVAKDAIRYVTHDVYKKWMSVDVTRGDCFLVSEGATLGHCMYWDENYPIVLGQRIFCLRANPEILYNRYLYAYMNTLAFQSEIVGRATGSSVSGLRQTEVLKLNIKVPPMAVQKFIGDTLYNLNKKAEVNNQTNQTLEQMAQAIFKSWFVDFEPVKAKMNGEQPEGMDDATASLFPETLDSETGIPAGWSQGVISDIAKLNAKSWTKKNQPEQVHYVDLANTKNGVIETVTTYDFDEAPSRARRVLNSGDTIVGTVRPGNRSFAFIGKTEQPLTGSTGFAVLSPKEEFWTSFVYLATTNDDTIDEYARLADGGAYPAIKPVVVADTPCVIPTTDVAQKFWQLTGAMLQKAHQNRLENEELAQLRDTLLPKLLSGEIELNLAEVNAND